MTEFDIAVKAVGGLSSPGKMPTLSWSTPAARCVLGSKLSLIEGSTCFGCYALKGFYVMPDTKNATERRFNVLMEALQFPLARAAFIENFTLIFTVRLDRTRKVVARRGKPGRDDGRYWRWHDAGDVQSVDHFRLLCEIAENSPDVEFWLPTRESGFVKGFLAEGGFIPPNLLVRLSVPMMDRAPSGVVSKLMANPTITASAVHTSEDSLEAIGADLCIAYTQNGKCDDCRSCWTGNPLISYPKH